MNHGNIQRTADVCLRRSIDGCDLNLVYRPRLRRGAFIRPGQVFPSPPLPRPFRAARTGEARCRVSGEGGGQVSLNETVASPCVGICKLDASTRLCEGCLRTVEEIGLWRDADAEWRRLVLRRIAARRTTVCDRPTAPQTLEAAD